MYQIEMKVERAFGGGQKRKVLLPIFYRRQATAEQVALYLRQGVMTGDDPQNLNSSTFAQFTVVPAKKPRSKTSKLLPTGWIDGLALKGVKK